MSVIFSLSGCKAVGKTTLLRGLKNKIPNLVIREGYRQTDTGFSLDIEQEYYENQRWYIYREIEEYHYYRKISNPVILLRGPEDVAFFSLHYPCTKKYDWDVKINLAEELEKLRSCRSDYIIYLDAPIEVILKRKNNDTTKLRCNMEDWMLNWQPYIESYLKKFPYTKIFDTENMDADKLLYTVLKWMQGKIQ